MKNLKNILTAIILLSTLTTTILAASTSNEIEINYYSEGDDVLTLDLSEFNFVKDIQLLKSTFDAPVIIELSDAEGVFTKIEIDGADARFLISSDGINTRHLISSDGINTRHLISSDGINTRFLISSDGINTRGGGLISSDGINTRVAVTVKQLGMVIFRDEL